MRATYSTGHLLHDAWLAFFVIIVAAGLLMGQGLVIGFGAMGLVAGAIAWFWNRLALEDVSYVRHLPQHRVFLGEQVSMTVALTNRKPVPLSWIRVEDEIPNALEVVEGDVDVNVRPNVQSLHHSTSMAWYERIRWDYQVRCTRRGMYRIGPAHIESGDPFGFLHSHASEGRASGSRMGPRAWWLCCGYTMTLSPWQRIKATPGAQTRPRQSSRAHWRGIFPRNLVRMATAAFNRACYGHHPASDDQIAQMRSSLAGIRAAVKIVRGRGQGLGISRSQDPG